MSAENPTPFEATAAGLIPAEELPGFVAHGIDAGSLAELVGDIRALHPSTDIDAAEVDGVACDLAARTEADGRQVISLIEPAGRNGEVMVLSLFTYNGGTYGEWHLDGIAGSEPEPQPLTTDLEFHLLSAAFGYKYDREQPLLAA